MSSEVLGHQIWCTWWSWGTLALVLFWVRKVKGQGHTAWKCRWVPVDACSIIALCQNALDGATIRWWPGASNTVRLWHYILTANLGAFAASTHVSCWWRQEGCPPTSMLQKIPTSHLLHPKTLSSDMRECSTLCRLLSFYCVSACLCMQSTKLLWQICPSVHLSHSDIVSKRMHISSNSFCYLVGKWLVFQALPSLQNSKGYSLIRALNTSRWEKYAIIDRNRRFSRKRCQISPRLLWITNRKS